jgi:hypothetical protein
MIKKLSYWIYRIVSHCRPQLVFALLLFVLGIAVWLRTLAPGIPISDPDTWGYLYPALSELAGQGFQQTHGRGIVYPLFLLGVLGFTGSFFSIVIAQHSVGILSGLLWWAVWREWQKWLPEKLSGIFWVQCIGLVFLASYLWNANTIFYEEAIRPESIFPFLALIQIYFCMVYARVRWLGGSNWLLLVAGSCAMLFAPICVSAKPSWGFAAGVPFALVAAGVFWKADRRALLTRIGALVIGFALVFLWMKLLPPALGWIPDERSKGFLPATLFTVHAPAISKVLHTRVEKGKSTPQEIAFLEKWDRRIKESSLLEKTSYRILDHDPDYLFYHSDAIADLPGADNAEKRREYMYKAYFDALIGFPMDIAAKIIKQLHVAHSNLTNTLYRKDYGFTRSFSGSIKSMDFYKLPEIDADLTASYRSVREQSEKIAKSQDVKLLFGPSVNKFLTLGVGPAFLGFWMLAWPALAVFVFFKRKIENNSLATATLAFGIFWATATGTTFTIATVHSFDINRYLHLFSVQHSMILAATIVITITWVSSKVAHFFSNKVS